MPRNVDYIIDSANHILSANPDANWQVVIQEQNATPQVVTLARFRQLISIAAKEKPNEGLPFRFLGFLAIAVANAYGETRVIERLYTHELPQSPKPNEPQVKAFIDERNSAHAILTPKPEVPPKINLEVIDPVVMLFLLREIVTGRGRSSLDVGIDIYDLGQYSTRTRDQLPQCRRIQEAAVRFLLGWENAPQWEYE